MEYQSAVFFEGSSECRRRPPGGESGARVSERPRAGRRRDRSVSNHVADRAAMIMHRVGVVPRNIVHSLQRRCIRIQRMAQAAPQRCSVYSIISLSQTTPLSPQGLTRTTIAASLFLEDQFDPLRPARPYMARDLQFAKTAIFPVKTERSRRESRTGKSHTL